MYVDRYLLLISLTCFEVYTLLSMAAEGIRLDHDSGYCGAAAKATIPSRYLGRLSLDNNLFTCNTQMSAR